MYYNNEKRELDVYENEIPGGQYTNLQFQAFSLGLADQFEEIKQMYKEANSLLGNIIKVTPSSKVVGDLAQFMVQNKLTKKMVEDNAEELSFPSSVIEYFQGYLGIPPGGFPEPLRERVLKGLPIVDGRHGAFLPEFDFDSHKKELIRKYGEQINDKDVISSAIYPKVFEDFISFREKYGPVSKLDTRSFLIGPDIGEDIAVDLEKGKTLHIKSLAKSNIVNNNGQREVFFELNGQLRTLLVRDIEASKELKFHPKAIKAVKGSIGAPMLGEIIDIKVKEGDDVEKGQPLAILTAMKMEVIISSPLSGKVASIAVEKGSKLEADDLVINIV